MSADKQQYGSYQKVGMNSSSSSVKDVASESKSSTKIRSFVGATILFVALCVGVLVCTKRSSVPNEGAAEIPLLGSTHGATPCTFEECFASSCNPSAAPYTCLFHNGGPHGGCSPTPWTPESCSVQCDLTGCDDLDIPDDVADCNQKCPENWCEMGRLCGSEAPYQCVAGASAFGCSKDSFHWTLRVSGDACSKCCKTTSCE